MSPKPIVLSTNVKSFLETQAHTMLQKAEQSAASQYKTPATDALATRLKADATEILGFLKQEKLDGGDVGLLMETVRKYVSPEALESLSQWQDMAAYAQENDPFAFIDEPIKPDFTLENFVSTLRLKDVFANLQELNEFDGTRQALQELVKEKIGIDISDDKANSLLAQDSPSLKKEFETLESVKVHPEKFNAFLDDFKTAVYDACRETGVNVSNPLIPGSNEANTLKNALPQAFREMFDLALSKLHEEPQIGAYDTIHALNVIGVSGMANVSGDIANTLEAGESITPSELTKHFNNSTKEAAENYEQYGWQLESSVAAARDVTLGALIQASKYQQTA